VQTGERCANIQYLSGPERFMRLYEIKKEDRGVSPPPNGRRPGKRRPCLFDKLDSQPVPAQLARCGGKNQEP